MAKFSVVLLTAPPPGLEAEANGAFIKIDGREALLRSVELFLNRDNIKQIQLVVSTDNADEAKRKFGGHLAFSGVKLLTAGPAWLDQTAAAAAALTTDCTHVLLHDAARPAVAYSDIDLLMDEADTTPVIALTTPIRSTIVELDDRHHAVKLDAPGKFAQIVTPWRFRRDAYLATVGARREPAPGDFTLLKGSPLNQRVGHGGDAGLARTLIGMLPKRKVKASENPFEEAQW